MRCEWLVLRILRSFVVLRFAAATQDDGTTCSANFSQPLSRRSTAKDPLRFYDTGPSPSTRLRMTGFSYFVSGFWKIFGSTVGFTSTFFTVAAPCFSPFIVIVSEVGKLRPPNGFQSA